MEKAGWRRRPCEEGATRKRRNLEQRCTAAAGFRRENPGEYDLAGKDGKKEEQELGEEALRLRRQFDPLEKSRQNRSQDFQIFSLDTKGSGN